MSVFTTPRPADTNKQLNDMVTRKMNRRDALRALQENAVMESNEKDTKEKLEAIDAAEDIKKSNIDKLDSLKEKVAKESMKRSLVTLENRLYESGRKEIFNQVIFEMVYNACWVDDEVKESTIESMYEAFNNTVDTLVENGINVDMTGNVTKFIQHVHEAVDKVCKKAASRIASEAMMSKNHINSKEEIENMFHFELNDDESTDLDNNLADLGKEDIEQLVKAKVLSVVQDEKEKGKAKSDEIESIKSELAATDDDDVVGDDEIALDNGESPETEEEDVPMDDSEDISGGMESYVVQSMITRKQNLERHRMTGTSLFECLMMANVHNLRTEVASLESMENGSPRNEQVMNAALQESIVVYTAMETLNTLELCKFDNSNVKRLSDFYKSTIK
jgi:hypothetical protein